MEDSAAVAAVEDQGEEGEARLGLEDQGNKAEIARRLMSALQRATATTQILELDLVQALNHRINSSSNRHVPLDPQMSPFHRLVPTFDTTLLAGAPPLVIEIVVPQLLKRVVTVPLPHPWVWARCRPRLACLATLSYSPFDRCFKSKDRA